MSAAATPVMPGTRAPADGYADGRAVRAHDGSRHAARDSLKLRMLLDPEARKAARLDYQKKVDAAQAEYTARHARPKPDSRGGDQRRGAVRLDIGQGRFSGAELLVVAEAGRVSVELNLPPSVASGDLSARLRSRLLGRGLDADVVVR